MMWDDGWGPGQWVAMVTMMLLFWGLIIAGIVALVHATRSDRHAPPTAAPPESSARRILDERFARGEVDADEYAQRRDLLDRS